MDAQSLLGILSSFQHARILVLGDVMLDRFIYGTVERISPEAPIPVMSIERTADMLGGAANVARNVATLGGKATLIGVIGQDSCADNLRDQLALIPTIQACLIVDASRPTTLKTRHVADRQQILRADIESRAPLTGAIAAAVLEQYTAALADVDAVVISDYGKGVLSEALAAAAINAARNRGRPVLVDPKGKSFLKYRGATVLTPNRSELQVAAGHECSSDAQVVAAAKTILAQEICAALVVTRGKEGMSIVEQDGSAAHIRTVAKEVYDVSGAGDTAAATLALGLSKGADIKQAARLANIAAGIVVGKYGTATVTAGEIVAILDRSAEGSAARKHFTLETVLHRVARWRELGLSIAFTNGCFDLLHPGHVSLLAQAKQSADQLVVGLNSDLSVRRLKGADRPVQGEVARATVLASLKSVDAVVIFEEDTPLALIGALEPDVLVKGADYTIESVVGADLIQQRGGKVILAEMVPAQSTTNTIRRLAGAAKA